MPHPQDHEHDFFTPAPEDMGAGAFGNQLRWQLVWLRLIADVWHDDDFKQQVLGASPDQIRQIFKQKYDYELNPYLNLHIEAVDVQPRIWPNKKWRPFDRIPPMELTIYVPPEPAAPHIAMALADYADAGRSYPFTTW
jgi:ribosomally synthesized peptide (two-chain TOMM family)